MHSMNEYSSAIQLRSDRWSSLRESTVALSRGLNAKEAAALHKKCEALFASLSQIEPYWAFPGMAAFEHMQRQLAHGNLEDLSFAVTRVTRALTTGAYRRRTTSSMVRPTATMRTPRSPLGTRARRGTPSSRRAPDSRPAVVPRRRSAGGRTWP